MTCTMGELKVNIPRKVSGEVDLNRSGYYPDPDLENPSVPR